VEWIEANRLECATFHILTPYPGTPLFAQMEAEGQLLHRNWTLDDTAHVVFRPKHLTSEQLAEGYAWCYRRLFSHASIWRRPPADIRAMLPYLAMSYLYKRSNRLWHWLISRRMTARVWRGLVEITRRRHLKFRRRLERETDAMTGVRSACVVSAGVERRQVVRTRLSKWSPPACGGRKASRGPSTERATFAQRRRWRDDECQRYRTRPGSSPTPPGRIVGFDDATHVQSAHYDTRQYGQPMPLTVGVRGSAQGPGQ
jgi:hypothetical protein